MSLQLELIDSVSSMTFFFLGEAENQFFAMMERVIQVHNNVDGWGKSEVPREPIIYICRSM